ncbi:aminotransferase class V-fold PLP-dependent enzyme [Gemmatimonas sp.]|jgi:selenocysteine lyase/cysteine desulfurase|uniref:aminotransferase class V-fold PLP-dependent enzyme n=1 Tax=Gemmatimonas sp. TaxID=1962908 RepID=UPI0037C10A30
MHKRDFLRTLGGAAIGFALSPAERQLLAATPPADLASREDFWSELRARYVVPTEFIHLEHGYYSMQSQPVLERYLQHIREVNAVSSRYMRTVQYPNKERVQGKLAALAGCSPRELIITRNTTESLDTVISGFDWKPGDEAVMGVHDYGAMLDQFSLMARRWGIANTRVTVPLDPASDDEVVQVYANAITPRTKLLMVCHMINITGHVLPVRKICDMAHARGVPVTVDGAHAFAQLDFRIPDLDCDFYGASLHKWLGTPLGAGILYVKPSAVEKLWPLYGDEGYAATDIRKLNHTGTHPVATDLAIEDAIAFHETIGIQRKEERLRWLQQYWTTKVRGVPRIKVFTPRDPARTGAIANVGIEGMKPGDLATALMEKYRIFTVAINTAGVTGVRVTPQLFTTTQELDALVRALTELAKA